jgi:LysR family glycine cleavage system transcriptional activator
MYAEEVSAAFARIETATRNVGRTGKSDVLTIHSTPSFATQWLMPRLARFSAGQPDIDVRLHASSEPADLVHEQVDLEIRYGGKRLQPAGTMLLPFPPETIVPLCAPKVALGEHPIRNPEDLNHHTLIHSEVCLVQWRDWLRLHRKVRLDITRGPRFDRSFMAIGAAADGLGVCLESLLIAQREIESGRLVAPLGLVGLQVNGYTLAVLKSRAELPKIRSFLDWLFAQLEGSAA